jgi:O-antigen ligase
VTTIAENRLALLYGGVAVGIAALAVFTGIVIALEPLLGLALVGFVALLGLAFLAPVAHLTLLLLVTVLLPYSIQNTLSAPGAGLLLSDALLLTALFRAAIALVREPLERRRMLALGLLAIFLAIVFLQAIHGLELGRSASQVGYELRVLLGFATFAIALPIIADPDGPRRMAIGLTTVGLLLGLWGIAQWSLGIEEIGESGVGVREGISFTSSGQGQLQGGIYAFPVAVVMSFAALVSGRIAAYWPRLAVTAVLVTNFVSLMLTYERTFWVTTVLGMAFVVLKSDPGRRARAVAVGAITGAILLGGFAVFAPQDFTAARERLVSLGQYSNDDSVRTRLVETEHVLAKIDESPLLGSGLGATIFWGRAWQNVDPEATWYSHNGYLWVTWKIGLAAAGCLFLLLGWAAFSRPPPEQPAALAVLRVGSQAALLTLLLSSITFPSFNALDITATMGVLGALALMSSPYARGSTRRV